MPPVLLGFHPPFCPRQTCPSHGQHKKWEFRRAGFYSRKASLLRIQRYTCVSCRASFSEQSFRATYYLKRPDLLVPVFHRLVGCSGFRQIAREFGVSHTTIMRISERLGRHCLLFNWRDVAKIVLDEPLVVDGFETYAHSQYYPCHFHLSIGAQSHFIFGFTDSELRRKGRMTEAQKKRRAELEAIHGRPDPRSIEKEFAAVIRLAPKGPPILTIRSDEHPAYPKGLRLSGRAFRHEVVSSRVRRTAENPLFAVNRADLVARHFSSNHKRETIAASKTRQNAAERLWVVAVYMNYGKSFSEKRQDATPAMRIGIADRKLKVSEILSERLFPWRIQPPERLEDYYWRRVSTGPRGRSRPHNLKLAV